MKILQVVHGFPQKQQAGTEIYTYYLSKELAKRHEVHVFYLSFSENEREFTINTFEKEGLHIHELIISHNLMKRFLNFCFFKNTYINRKIEMIFRNHLKDINPDIIHFEHLITLSATLIDVVKELNIPSILTLHDYWFICQNVQLLRWDSTICDSPKPRNCQKCWSTGKREILAEVLNIYFHFPFKITKIIGDFFAQLIRSLNPPGTFRKRNDYLKSLLLKVDKSISPSRFLREVFIRNGVPEDKIIYSENGYNLGVFNGFKKKEKKTDKITFGFVGSISKHKGIHILIDAFMRVPEDKAELRIYGNYSLRSSFVKEMLQRIKNKPNIYFVGPFVDVKKPYSEFDILIVPSIWHETGGPQVVREAFATRTPVIASNLGSIPEAVKDKKTGLLFVPSNPNDLHEKIMTIIEHPELIKRFETNIRPPKDIKDQAKEIEGIYLEVVQKEDEKLQE